MSSLLLSLLKSAEKSNKRGNQGQRFDAELKKIARYVFQIGGPKQYNFLNTDVFDLLGLT